MLQQDERRNHFAAKFVGTADHAALGHRRVLQARALDLDGADAVAGNLDDLVGAAAEPHVAVLVNVRGVAGVVDAGNTLPIVAAVAFLLAPQSREESGKRTLQDHDAFFARGARRAIERDHGRVDAGQRDRRRSGLDRQHAETVRIAEHRTTGLGLPHVIDDRHASAENRVLQPVPCGCIEHFTRTDDALEARMIDREQRFVAVAHQHADRRR